MLSSVIIGFYRCKDSKGNDLYVYITKSPKGKLYYNFTSDYNEALEVAAKFCNSNKYNKDNFKNIINDYPDSFNLNCKDTKEVLERVKRANPNEVIEDDKFNEAKEKVVKEEKEGILDRIKNKISNLEIGTKIKNLWVNKKIKRFVIGAVAALSAVSIFSCSLNRCSGPTANNSKNATVDDTTDNDDTLDDDTIKDVTDSVIGVIPKIVDETIKNIEKEETKEKEVSDTETYSASSNQSSSNSNNSLSNNQSLPSFNSSSSNNQSSPSNSNNSSSSTTTEGSVNENLNEFQDPNVSLDNSNNQDSGSTSDNEQEEDKYQNVSEEEVPVVDNNPSLDENYTEEIDVSADDEDEITKDDIIFDEGYENDNAVDNDYTYDINYDTDNSSDYEITYEELPDPNETAADGNYVSSEEEMINQESSTTNNEQVTEVYEEETTDTVPVYQEETDSKEEFSNTVENNNTDLETAVDQAIDVMAEGNDVSIVYDANTFQYNTEVINNSEMVEGNSLTK